MKCEGVNEKLLDAIKANGIKLLWMDLNGIEWIWMNLNGIDGFINAKLEKSIIKTFEYEQQFMTCAAVLRRCLSTNYYFHCTR